MITSALPARLNTDTSPLAVFSFTVTALGMVWPGVQLMLETVGRAEPCGQMDRNDEDVVSVAVTLSTTASASAGTPPCPPTATSRDTAGPHGVE